MVDCNDLHVTTFKWKYLKPWYQSHRVISCKSTIPAKMYNLLLCLAMAQEGAEIAASGRYGHLGLWQLQAAMGIWGCGSFRQLWAFGVVAASGSFSSYGHLGLWQLQAAMGIWGCGSFRPLWAFGVVAASGRYGHLGLWQLQATMGIWGCGSFRPLWAFGVVAASSRYGL